MKHRSIEVHIEEVVLAGFDVFDRAALERGLERQLVTQLQRGSATFNDASHGRLLLPALELKADSSAFALGTAIGDAVHAAVAGGKTEG